MQNYLFVHFKESTTPEGEQVYFSVSRDGFNWEKINNADPVLWAYYGDKGVRDFTIVKNKFNNKYYIIATDLSLSYGMRNQYNHSWMEISQNGSKYFSMWESEDLCHWSEQSLVSVGGDFGCMWAPDVILDRENDEYILHWSSPLNIGDASHKAIFYSKTKDFKTFSPPELLYNNPNGGVIDSAMYFEDGFYYLFVKNEAERRIFLLKSTSPTQGWERCESFDKMMDPIANEAFEAPTAFKTDEGKWVLLLDYFGRPGKYQGYVPFVASSLAKADFVRSEEDFSFPYKFKHGTVLTITEEDYERLKQHIWEIEDNR